MSTDSFTARRKQIGQQLAQLSAEIPGVMSGFRELHRGALADGALDRRTKELVALAISIAIRCDGCIAYHVRDALEAGATREEILEIIGVAILMGGGPSTVYGADARRALDEYAPVAPAASA